MSSISGPSGYVFETLREGADFTLYRGRQHGDPSPVLAIEPSAEQPSPQSLRRLEHEYSLAAELDPAWAAKPIIVSVSALKRLKYYEIAAKGLVYPVAVSYSNRSVAKLDNLNLQLVPGD